MRMRKKKWAIPFLNQHEEFIYFLDEESESIKIDYNNIRLEIGCGKGDFICGLAKLYPNDLCIAVEKDENAAAVAGKKIFEQGLCNVLLFVGDGQYINRVLGDKKVMSLYLNHSDPWPKKAHEKRRLTYKTFLDLYKTFLSEDGQLIQKTDNQAFFEYSLVSITNNGYCLQQVFLNYDVNKYLDCDVMTEYEEKFVNLGQPIYKAVYNNRHEK